jgi:hypothetical protein
MEFCVREEGKRLSILNEEHSVTRDMSNFMCKRASKTAAGYVIKV